MISSLLVKLSHILHFHRFYHTLRLVNLVADLKIAFRLHLPPSVLLTFTIRPVIIIIGVIKFKTATGFKCAPNFLFKSFIRVWPKKIVLYISYTVSNSKNRDKIIATKLQVLVKNHRIQVN